MGREGGGAVDALGGFEVVGGAGLEDGGDELLGVAVDEGEPGGLDLDHEAVAFEDDVVAIAEGDGQFDGGVRGEGA